MAEHEPPPAERGGPTRPPWLAGEQPDSGQRRRPRRSKPSAEPEPSPPPSHAAEPIPPDVIKRVRVTSRLPAIERRMRAEQSDNLDSDAHYREPDGTPRWRAAPPQLRREDLDQDAGAQRTSGRSRHAAAESADHLGFSPEDPVEPLLDEVAEAYKDSVPVVSDVYCPPDDEPFVAEDVTPPSESPDAPAAPNAVDDVPEAAEESNFSAAPLGAVVPDVSAGRPSDADHTREAVLDETPSVTASPVSDDWPAALQPTTPQDVPPTGTEVSNESLPNWSDLDSPYSDQPNRGRHHLTDTPPATDPEADAAAPSGHDPLPWTAEREHHGNTDNVVSDHDQVREEHAAPEISTAPEPQDTTDDTQAGDEPEPDDIDARAEQLLAMMAARRAQQNQTEPADEPAELAPDPAEHAPRQSVPDDALSDLDAQIAAPVDPYPDGLPTDTADTTADNPPEPPGPSTADWLPEESAPPDDHAADTHTEHDEIEDRAAHLLALRQQALSADSQPSEPAADADSSSALATPPQPSDDAPWQQGSAESRDDTHEDPLAPRAADEAPASSDPLSNTDTSAAPPVGDAAGDAPETPLNTPGRKRSDKRRTLPPWQVPSAAMSREFDPKLDQTGRQVVRDSPRKSPEPHHADIQAYDPMQRIESAGSAAVPDPNLPPAADTAPAPGAPAGPARGRPNWPGTAAPPPVIPAPQLPPPGWGNVPPPPAWQPPPPMNVPLLPPPPPGGWPAPPPPGQWAPAPPPPAPPNHTPQAGAPPPPAPGVHGQQRPPHPPAPAAPPNGPPQGFGHPQPYRMATPIDDAEVLKRSRQAPQSGWRRTLHTATGGRINPGDSRKNRQMEELLAQIRQPIVGDFRIAVLSIKGGVGKTTTTLGLGSALAMARTDRVIAVDANPDRGTLAERVRDQSTRSTVRDLLRDPNIRRYGDVRSHTRMSTSRLEILASEQDPAIAEVFRETDYRHTIDILRHYYNIILTDCGTGIMHSAMAGVLDLAHAIVLVSSPAIDAARSASATLDWLMQHGHSGLVRDAHVVLSASRPGAAGLRLDKVYEHFEARCRSIHMVPFDPHLAEGADMDFTMLKPATVQAYIELAGAVSEKFSHLRAHHDGR